MNSELVDNQYCQHALDLKKQIELRFLELGQVLWEIREGRKYEAGWSSWIEFEMELGLAPSTVSKLLNIYQKFVLEYEFSAQKIIEAGGWTKVALLLPLVDSKESASDWLETASHTTYRDLGINVREAKTGKEQKDCSHSDAYTIRVCPDCGDRERIY